MTKKKRKLTPDEKRAKARRKAEFMFIFLNGRQKRVPRPGFFIDGVRYDEFDLRTADPIWLHQNELWEYMPEFGDSGPEVRPVQSGSVQASEVDWLLMPEFDNDGDEPLQWWVAQP